MNLYIHEIAIHEDHNVDEFAAPYDMVGPDPSKRSAEKEPDITSAHVDAMIVCLESCHRTLDACLGLDLATARAMNNLHLVWTTYAVVALIKIHTLVRAPGSKYAAIFTVDLKAEYYLDAITLKLIETAGAHQCRPAEAFTYVFTKLKAWFKHKKDADTESERNTQRGDAIASGMTEALNAFSACPMGEIIAPLTATPAKAPNSNISEFNTVFNDINNLDASTFAAQYFDNVNFDASDMQAFDMYMNDSGWMGYLM